MSAPTIPAFDTGSPDVLLLAAQDELRRQRAWSYSFDDVPDADWPHQEMDVSDDRCIDAENVIWTADAKTIPGIIAKLQTQLTLECERWLDRRLSEGGFLAIYCRIDEMDGKDHQVVRAIHDLYRLDWAQALAAYERAEQDLTAACNGRNVTDTFYMTAYSRGKREGPAFAADAAAEAAQDFFIDRGTDAARALMRTLTPDHDAYQRKVKIMAHEGLEEALSWLARDTAFLLGRLYAPTIEGAR